MNNPPEMKGENLSESICAFFQGELQSDVTPTGIKACHYLSKANNSTIIVEFDFFSSEKFLVEVRETIIQP